jgi:hypothetical protein
MNRAAVRQRTSALISARTRIRSKLSALGMIDRRRADTHQSPPGLNIGAFLVDAESHHRPEASGCDYSRLGAPLRGVEYRVRPTRQGSLSSPSPSPSSLFLILTKWSVPAPEPSRSRANRLGRLGTACRGSKVSLPDTAPALQPYVRR